MITEDYVSFETAKLLKEKGFDLLEFTGKWAIDYDNVPHDDDEDSDGEIIIAEWHYPLITLQMAMKWLREVQNTAIVITPSIFWGKYNVSIYKKGNNYPFGFSGDSLVSSYEEACEAAIKYCLENLI